MAKKPDDAEILDLDGHQVRISSPTKLYFAQQVQLTKLDIVRYFLAVAPGALNGIADRPIVLKRFVNGAHAEPFYQKRAPDNLPGYVRTVTLSFPSGRTAEEAVLDNPAALAWAVNLGCIELHPHPVRTADLDHPDQLRVDLDPNPGVSFEDVRLVALEVAEVLKEAGLTGFAKTSGSRGIHINVPIFPRWTFTEVRRAALALARAVERRIPALATSKWWKEERHGVFLDYNQNAKDRTTASAYSVRPLPDARVSAPLTWAELPDVNPADFTVLTMPVRFATLGDPHANMQSHAGSLDRLLELAAADEASGEGDAPWPPHFAKGESEPKRVQPSKAKPFADQIGEGFGQKRFRKQAKKSDSPADEPGAPSFPASPERVGSEPPLTPPAPKNELPENPPTPSSPSLNLPTRPPPSPASTAGAPPTRKPQPSSPKTTSSPTACAAPPTSGTASESTYATSLNRTAPSNPPSTPTKTQPENSRLPTSKLKTTR